MGKMCDLFRKIGDIKGTFLQKMDTIKDSNSSNLVDTEEIKKTWKGCMEELYNRDPNEPIATMVRSASRARYSGE